MVLHDERPLLLGLPSLGDLSRPHAEIRAHDEDTHFIGYVVEHLRRIVPVVLDDADIGFCQVVELSCQPLPFVHVGKRVITPGHELLPVEQ